MIMVPPKRAAVYATSFYCIGLTSHGKCFIIIIVILLDACAIAELENKNVLI